MWRLYFGSASRCGGGLGQLGGGLFGAGVWVGGGGPVAGGCEAVVVITVGWWFCTSVVLVITPRRLGRGQILRITC